MERHFDVGSLVVVLQKLRTVQAVEVIHARPELRFRFPTRLSHGVRLERDIGDRSVA